MDHMNKTTRREFLRQSSGFVIAAGVLSRLGCAFGAERKEPWLLAVRDVYLRLTGEKDCWAAMKSLSVGGVEVEVGRDFACSNLFAPAKEYSIGTDKAIEELGRELRSHDLKIPAFCLHNRFDERPEEEVSWTVAVARAADKIGTKAIRIDVVPRRLRGDEFFTFAVDTCKRLVEKTEGTGVRLGIENHGGTTNQVEFLDKLLEAVGSQRMGLTLDTANFYWFGYPLKELYGIYRKFAKRVVHTHCKSIRYPEEKRNEQRPMGWEYGKYNCPIYEGDIDFEKVVGILRAAGYDNDLCVEDESLGKFPEEKQAAVLKQEVEFLRGLL
jgi:sugar phosphate isomerase/epimerase